MILSFRACVSICPPYRPYSSLTTFLDSPVFVQLRKMKFAQCLKPAAESEDAETPACDKSKFENIGRAVIDCERGELHYALAHLRGIFEIYQSLKERDQRDNIKNDSMTTCMC